MHCDPTRLAVFGIVRRGQASIHFNRGQQARLPSRQADGAYDLYFNVVSLDALADKLRACGADILDGPEERVYGQRELVVRIATASSWRSVNRCRPAAPNNPQQPTSASHGYQQLWRRSRLSGHPL